MSPKVVVLDESEPARDIVCAILRHGGFQATAAESADRAIQLVAESAPERVFLLLSATLAASLGDDLKRLVSGNPRPAVTLMCTDSSTCPLHPGLPCPDLGCIRKPLDVTTQRLVGRLTELAGRA
jgi:CheY-like chemotaxis protein